MILMLPWTMYKIWTKLCPVSNSFLRNLTSKLDQGEFTFEDAGLKLFSNIVKRFAKVENQLVSVPERGLEMEILKRLVATKWPSTSDWTM